MAINKKEHKEVLKTTAVTAADNSLNKVIIDRRNLLKSKKGHTAKAKRSLSKKKKKQGGLIQKAKGTIGEINKKAEEVTGLKPKDDNKIRFSAWYVIDQVLSLQLMFLLAALLIFGIIVIAGDLRPYIFPVAFILLCVFLFIDLSWSILTTYQGKNSYYELTPKEIIYHNRGFFFKRTHNYPVGTKTEFILRQGVRGILLHFGTIRITDPSFSKPIRMRRISKPESSIKKLVSLKPK